MDGNGGTGRRARLWLALGAAAGIGLALASVLRTPDAGPLPTEIVARVNGVDIRRSAYERALNALARDRRDPLSEADKRHVLDRLIDEELLVQYAESLQLERSDRRIRGDMVSAVIAAQVAAVDGIEPTREDLEALLRENPDFFRSPERLHVRSLWLRIAPERTNREAVARARIAVAALRRGEDFDSVEAEYGDPQVAPVPDGPLPPAKLREYIGPSPMMIAERMKPGEVSEPIIVGNGVRVLVLVGRSQSPDPTLEEVEDEVRSEWIRRAGDAALRRLLVDLRDDGRIRVAEPLP